MTTDEPSPAEVAAGGWCEPPARVMAWRPRGDTYTGQDWVRMSRGQALGSVGGDTQRTAKVGVPMVLIGRCEGA